VPYPLPVIAEPSIFISAQTEADEKHERDQRRDDNEREISLEHQLLGAIFKMVLMTVSGFKDMLSIPSLERKAAKSG
jgi:hypothetical protein